MFLRGVFPFGLILLCPAMAFRGSAEETSSLAQDQTLTPSVLTNEDVVKMVEAKIADAVIIAKIKASPAKFDTSTNSLIRLKQAGISDAVLEAMVQASGAPSKVAPVPPDLNDPLSPHEVGIWMMKSERRGKHMTQIEPTSYSQVKLGGPLRVPVPVGVALKSKWKAVVRGEKSRLRVSEPKPVFYFYFERSSAAGGQGSQGQNAPVPPGTRGIWFGDISGPGQFTLARFEVKKDERELVIGEMGGLGASISMGVSNKDAVEFDFEKLVVGIYKVTPRVDLEPGEYCFLYTGAGVGVMAAGKLFDFGVNPAK